MSSQPAAVNPRWVRLPDWVLAVALLIAVEVGVAIVPEIRPGWRWLAGLTAALAVVPLAWRHRAPLLVWAIVAAATLAGRLNHGTDFKSVALLVALYTVATTSPRRISLAAGAATAVWVTLGEVGADRHGLRLGSVVFPALVVAAVWLVGDNLRVRRAYVAELEAKAARADLERAADAARAAAQERTRIARELHDIVVHHVSVIAVQAGAARMLADRTGAAGPGRQAWVAVEDTARTALRELRQLLGLLRSDGEPPSLSPAPGIDQLDRLLDDVRRAGLPVEARFEGTPRAIPSAVDLAAYRIVQEALTNVLKHAGPVPTTVILRYCDDDIHVEVTDAGPQRSPGQPEAGGHGLVGMRERVGLLGGRLDAHPDSGGGFAVVASIPTGGQSA
jgi:signal transduction histidine kinase